MIIPKVKKLPVEERFLYWIKEREAIRLKKEAGKLKPWTDDEILQRYRFCNVRRMDDRVSQWLLKNWYELYFDHPNMVAACTLARNVNRIETLYELGFPKRWDPKRCLRILYHRKEQGKPNLNGAYIISCIKGWKKIDHIVWNIVDQIARDPPEIDTNSVSGTWDGLMGCMGFGSFIAGQVSADLRWGLSGLWADRHTWAPVGPGSRRGLNRLLQQPGRAVNQKRFIGEFPRVLDMVKQGVPQISKRLEAIDVQNCLCEWDKYERTLWGEGRPKQIYKQYGVIDGN